MAAQWYETEEGRRRLQVEMAAIDTFNRPRPEELRLVGRKHKQGHLILSFAFRPIATRPEVVRGEVILSARHPSIEPAARIVSPVVSISPHLIDGEGARASIQQRSIPVDWARQGPVLCMFDHLRRTGPDRWSPAMTVVSVVLGVQSWWLNYLHYKATGTWPYDKVA